MLTTTQKRDISSSLRAFRPSIAERGPIVTGKKTERVREVDFLLARNFIEGRANASLNLSLLFRQGVKNKKKATLNYNRGKGNSISLID